MLLQDGEFVRRAGRFFGLSVNNKDLRASRINGYRTYRASEAAVALRQSRSVVPEEIKGVGTDWDQPW